MYAHVRGGGVALLLMLTAGACGGGGGGSGAGSATTSARPSAATTLTGTRLAGLLLPASAMPKGFRLNADGTRNSVDTIAPPSRDPLPPGALCQTFTQTAWVRAAETGPASFAQSDYLDQGNTQEIALDISVFHPGEGPRVLDALKQRLDGCASFTAHENGNTFKVRTRLSQSTAESFKAVLTSPSWEGGNTLAAVRVGDAVVTVLYSSMRADKGAAAVGMAERMAAALRTAK